MKANRPHRVTFQTKRPNGETTLDDYGDEIEAWSDAFDEYAAIFYGTGTEQREAAQMQANQTATFEVLSNARTRAISTGTTRVVYNGAAWDVRAVAEIGLNNGVKVTATRAAA